MQRPKHKRQWSRSPLVLIISCRLFGTIIWANDDLFLIELLRRKCIKILCQIWPFITGQWSNIFWRYIWYYYRTMASMQGSSVAVRRPYSGLMQKIWSNVSFVKSHWYLFTLAMASKLANDIITGSPPKFIHVTRRGLLLLESMWSKTYSKLLYGHKWAAILHLETCKTSISIQPRKLCLDKYTNLLISSSTMQQE